MPIEARRVNFELFVRGTSDRNVMEFAEGVAKVLQDLLNENCGELLADFTVEVTDLGEGG